MYMWQGIEVTGSVESEYVSSTGTRYFIKLTEPVPDEFVQDRQGHDWPIKGSIILVD